SIRAMRLEAGLTPVALAEKVGVSGEVIANLEAGKIEPQSDLIEHIAIVLGRRLRDFVDERESERGVILLDLSRCQQIIQNHKRETPHAAKAGIVGDKEHTARVQSRGGVQGV